MQKHNQIASEKEDIPNLNSGIREAAETNCPVKNLK